MGRDACGGDDAAELVAAPGEDIALGIEKRHRAAGAAIEEMIDGAESLEGDRYPLLLDIHDALRTALAETDGDPAATGR